MSKFKTKIENNVSIVGLPRPVTLLYSEIPPDGVTLIARVDCDKVTPKTCVDIEDIDNGTGNIVPGSLVRETLSGSKRYKIQSSQFILSDYTINGNIAPYVHKLKYPVWKDTVGRSSVKLVKSNGVVADQSLWKYDTRENQLYLITHNKKETPSGPAIFYVEYIRANANNGIVDLNHRELLNAVPICKEITPLDTGCLNQITFRSHSYSIDVHSTGSYNPDLYLNVSSTYPHYIEYSGDKQIYIQKPSANDLQNPWYCSIRGTEAFKSHLLDGFSVISRYALVEHLLLNYFPWYPLMPSGLVKATRVDGRIYFVSPSDIYIDTPSPLAVIVKKGNKIIRALATHDISMDEYKGIKWDIGNVDVDQLQGIISLPDEYDNEHEVYAYYFYKEQGVPYVEKDFNPYHDPNVLDQATIIYMKPSISNDSVRSVYHLVCDRDMQVWKLADSMPQYICNDPSLHDRSDSSRNPLYQPMLQQLLTSQDALEWMQTHHPEYLILGIVRVSSGISLSNTSVVDARTEGGGIDIHKVDDALYYSNLVLYLNSIGASGGIIDGGSKALVVKVAQSVIDNGFTKENIEEIVSKYITAGTKVICQVEGEDGW